jgi:CMP-N-acetylneuraminic acid synthetase/NAD(P)-dependent dehydrogenase (short-subunit alcohol dehydrogenase family)
MNLIPKAKGCLYKSLTGNHSNYEKVKFKMVGICVISARGGSQGVPGKNIKHVLGKPLIVWSIEQALEIPEIDRVVVSTDSPEIAKIAKAAGAEVPFLRPQHLSTSEAGKFQVWQHALETCEKAYNQEYDFFIDLDCTNPLRDIEDISAAIKQFKDAQTRNVDAVFSVCEARKNPYFNVLEKNGDGSLKICKKGQNGQWIVRRQDAPEVLEHVASIYVLKPEFLKSNAQNLLDGKTEGYYIAPEKTFDLDSDVDLELIEFFLRKKLQRNHQPLLDVVGKRVVLVGATGVLGSFYSRLLVSEGCVPFLVDKPGSSVLTLGKELGVPAIEMDVTKEQDVVSGFAHISEQFDGIDAVINNAAVTSEGLASGGGDPFSPFENSTLDVWQAAIDVNLSGTFLVAREGGRIMKENGGGSLINVSSIYGVVGPDHSIYDDMPFKSFAGYSASKSGVIGLTRWLASWWGKDNLRVNCVSPGGVFNGHTQEFEQRYSAKTAMGRMANPDDIAGMVLYLISDGSKYCTGQNFIVDGGFTCQ